MLPCDDPFIRAVLADPDDDLPRLIYADRLDETGEPERAEFVRVQIELSRYPVAVQEKVRRLVREEAEGYQTLSESYDTPDEFDAGDLAEREWELLEGHGGSPGGRMTNWGEWLDIEPLRHICRVRARPWRETVTFRRGFVSEITCTAADWIAHADAILAACPVRRVWRADDRTPAGEWRGDGLVRLTSPPTVSYRPEDDTLRLVGREKWHRIPADAVTTIDSGETARRTTLELLTTEWPGVAFTLPPFDMTAHVQGLLDRAGSGGVVRLSDTILLSRPLAIPPGVTIQGVRFLHAPDDPG